jgi:hypothetical protein
MTTATIIGEKQAFFNSTKANGTNKDFGILVANKAVAKILIPFMTKAGLTKKGEGTEVAKGIQLIFTGNSEKALRLALKKAKGRSLTPTFKGKACKYLSETVVKAK